jgi:hypothetical protein
MDRPILISAPLIRPTIERRKILTRRVAGLGHMNEKPDDWVYIGGAANMGRELEIIDGKQEANFYNPETSEEHQVLCPYGAPGTKLWVREGWYVSKGYDGRKPRELDGSGHILCGYIADGNKPGWGGRGRAGIHMPRHLSRITLELLKVGVERAHRITEGDAILEGVDRGILRDGPNSEKGQFQLEMSSNGSPIGTYRDGFIFTWMTLNGRDSWEKNPWVWRLFFKLANVKYEPSNPKSRLQ